MSSAELRKRFLEFFEKRGHKVIPSSSLIPDDPSVLLTTAGMQQFKKYYTDPSLAPAPNVASIQKCFRTSDIDEVGDESHLTFFEMLGNFSFGGYFKEEAITYAHEFITKELNLKIDYVTVFGGGAARIRQNNTPYPWGRDKESNEIWNKIDPKIRIELRGKQDNFWGPTGSEGPCGPTTEIYVNGTEVWNIVFNQFYQHSNGILEPLRTQGIDTGMGLERLAMVSQGKKTIFETDLFEPLMRLMKGMAGGWSARIATDHIRGIVFLIADGVMPSNKEQGYVLRRLIRRVIPHLKERQTLSRFGDGMPIPKLASLKMLVEQVINQYGEEKMYGYLLDKKNEILRIVEEEQKRFLQIYDNGNKILFKLVDKAKDDATFRIQGADIFSLVATYGFALEWIKDTAKFKGIELDLDGFKTEFKKHQEISRAGQEKKFGGHGLLLDTGELKAADEEELKKVTRLHTATHLLQAALRKVLGEGVKQAGSDITVERTRFDFTFDRKLTDEEIRKIEDLVNFAVSKKFDVQMKEMSYEEALKAGALHFFKEKYLEKVKVYSVGDFRADPPEIFSRELCGGPHVKNTSEIGRFKILKQEAVGSGTRRVRATVE